jgi:hypothetical protein
MISYRKSFVVFLVLAFLSNKQAYGFSFDRDLRLPILVDSLAQAPKNNVAAHSRRQALVKGLAILSGPTLVAFHRPSIVNAYTPDSDPLRESLYLICRVQEATCLQERYINKKSPPIKKMKLTLRLVDRSYRLLDQINYVSKFIPDDNVVMAVQAGNEAAESLQDALDFVFGYQKDGDSMTKEQKDFLLASLADTREKLFEFIDYLPDKEKIAQARARVEEENKLNVDEFDPDLANDAGIFNPIELPWKKRGNSQAPVTDKDRKSEKAITRTVLKCRSCSLRLEMITSQSQYSARANVHLKKIVKTQNDLKKKINEQFNFFNTFHYLRFNLLFILIRIIKDEMIRKIVL